MVYLHDAEMNLQHKILRQHNIIPKISSLSTFQIFTLLIVQHKALYLESTNCTYVAAIGFTSVWSLLSFFCVLHLFGSNEFYIKKLLVALMQKADSYIINEDITEQNCSLGMLGQLLYLNYDLKASLSFISQFHF